MKAESQDSTVLDWNCQLLQPEPPSMAPNVLEFKMWLFDISVYYYLIINIKSLI